MNWTLTIGIITGVIIPVLGYHLYGYERTKENLYSKIHDNEKEITRIEKLMLDKYIKEEDIKELIKDLKIEIKENRKEFIAGFGKLSEELKDHAKINKTI